MQAEVKHGRDAIEFYTPERCFIQEVANDAGDSQISVARARVAPGVTTAWHKLIATSERYLIISGQGRVQLGQSAPVDVTAGDVVRIPAETPQRIENCGPDDLVFYAICVPPFQPDAYISLEP